MNKTLLLAISFLVFIIGISCASAVGLGVDNFDDPVAASGHVAIDSGNIQEQHLVLPLDPHIAAKKEINWDDINWDDIINDTEIPFEPCAPDPYKPQPQQ